MTSTAFLRRAPAHCGLIALLLVGCARTPEELPTLGELAGNSPIMELAISATYSGFVPDSVEPFDYEKAERRKVRVIDVSVEPYAYESQSVRLTLDPANSIELNGWLPHGLNCDLLLFIDRQLVANVYTRAPFDDVLYVNGFSPNSREPIDSIASRVRRASDLDADAEYAPTPDTTSWIELERPACSQRCPQYTMRVHGDGSITYVGSTGVARVGRRDGTISAAAVRRLFTRFAAARFFELPANSATSRDDLLPSTLTLNVRGRTKRCERRTGEASGASDANSILGETLDLLANAVDLESGSRHWVGKSDRNPRPLVARDPEYAPKDPNAFELRFKRGGAFEYPIYELSIRSDGTVNYRGIEDVAVLGKATTVIAPQMVDELIDRLQLIRFWQLEDEYIRGVMDAPGTSITLSIDGRTKTVANSWMELGREEPINAKTQRELDAVARAIDAAVDAQAWFAPNNLSWDRELEASARLQR